LAIHDGQAKGSTSGLCLTHRIGLKAKRQRFSQYFFACCLAHDAYRIGIFIPENGGGVGFKEA
jgi:hypothetical protein